MAASGEAGGGGRLHIRKPNPLDVSGPEDLVVRSHGPVIPGRIADMIGTFNGGCQHPGPDFPDPLPPELGAPGPNLCEDVRFAIHLP